jgi:lysophospholipase L1-like esterase
MFERRKFIKQLTAFSTAAVVAPASFAAMPVGNYRKSYEGNGYTFLFQGDSITDGNRTRNNDWNHVMGHGYQYILSSKLWYDFPKKDFHFFNRGISGNKVTDLAARWQIDTLDIKPDLLSILIGINDVAAFINGDKTFDAAQYETGYRSLLTQTRQALPSVQFVLGEPFILPSGNIKNNWDTWLSEVQSRQVIVKKLCVEFDAVHVPFQQAFNKALSKAPAAYWIWDGIHPMPAGHELMAIEWMNAVSKKLKFIK